MQVKVKRLNDLAYIPQYQSDGAAAFDIHSTEEVLIKPGEWRIIGSGLAFEIPTGYVGYFHARSGTAAKNGIMLVNGVGVIDSDYRGEVKSMLYNAGNSGFKVEIGDRIGQMIIGRLPMIELVEAEELSDTVRGEGGFGSTGIK